MIASPRFSGVLFGAAYDAEYAANDRLDLDLDLDLDLMQQGGGAQVLFSTVLTGSFVSILPLIIAFLFLQRYWQSGLATGSVKG